MDATDILPSVEKVYQYLLAASFAFSRILGVMIVMPSFTRLGVTTVVRSGIALTLSLPLVPMLVGSLATGISGSLTAGFDHYSLPLQQWFTGGAVTTTGVVLNRPIAPSSAFRSSMRVAREISSIGYHLMRRSSATAGGSELCCGV